MLFCKFFKKLVTEMSNKSDVQSECKTVLGSMGPANGMAMGLILAAILYGLSYLFGWLVIGPDPRAEVKINARGGHGTSAVIEVSEKDRVFWMTYWFEDKHWSDLAPGTQAACQDALEFIADYGGIGDRISYHRDSLVTDCATLPTTVNVQVVLEELYDGHFGVNLVSTDYNALDWQYFDYTVEGPTGHSIWPDRQTALSGARAIADRYGFTVVEVICGSQACDNQMTGELQAAAQAEVRLRSGPTGFYAYVRIEQRDENGEYRYLTQENLDSAPGTQAACQDALEFIADYGGIGDRISYHRDSLVTDCATLPTTVNVQVVLEELYDGHFGVNLVSTDYNALDWQYFDYTVEGPTGHSIWPDRQTALSGAQDLASHYGLTIIEVTDK